MADKKIILSVLICTIDGREDKLLRLMTELGRQIKKHNLLGEVEILTSKDRKGEHTIGYKRNLLLQNCLGEWANFIDDDDMICDDFLPLTINCLKTFNPDVIMLQGVLTVNGMNPQVFIHGLQFTEWFERDGIYYRPPNHLNPIRTSLSKAFRFPEISHGEDKEWSMAICRAGVLKTEATIGKPYYFYEYQSNK